MANAPESLKASSHLEVISTNDDGVAKFLSDRF
jgi:hydroxymethylpyrimidine pyrophosphatase-like HAD family hydrolase